MRIGRVRGREATTKSWRDGSEYFYEEEYERGSDDRQRRKVFL
jgi:hypothetical protein